MVAGKIVVSGVPRLPLKTRHPANNKPSKKYHTSKKYWSIVGNDVRSPWFFRLLKPKVIFF